MPLVLQVKALLSLAEVLKEALFLSCLDFSSSLHHRKVPGHYFIWLLILEVLKLSFSIDRVVAGTVDVVNQIL